MAPVTAPRHGGEVNRFLVLNILGFVLAGSQLKSRCEELKLDWGSLCLESLLKEKQALRRQISEKQKHCLELQVNTAPFSTSLPTFCLFVHIL